MNTLIVVRHAKAESAHLHERDFDRPLTWKGADDARQAAEAIRTRHPEISMIIASPARRTATTAEIIAQAYGWGADRIVMDERIYEASVKTLTEIVAELASIRGEVILVGHNPGVLELCYALTNGNVTSMSTSAVVEIPML